jgi:predicted nucleotidyltransferase
MRTGVVEANLLVLNESFKLPYVNGLVARKLAGLEQSTLDDDNIAFHQGEYDRLVAMLEEASAQSTLPDAPQAREELDELLIRLRLG